MYNVGRKKKIDIFLCRDVFIYGKILENKEIVQVDLIMTRRWSIFRGLICVYFWV